MTETSGKTPLVAQIQSMNICATILEKMREGSSIDSIIRWLRFDCLMFSEIPDNKLRTALSQLFVISFGESERAAISMNRAAIKQLSNKYYRNVRVRSELEDLYALQKGRLAIAVQLEAENKILLDNTHKEMGVAIKILERIESVDTKTNKLKDNMDEHAQSKHDIEGEEISHTMLTKLGLVAKKVMDKTVDEE